LKKLIMILAAAAFLSVLGLRLYQELSTEEAQSGPGRFGGGRQSLLVETGVAELHQFESILEVLGEGKGPQIVVSRSHPEFIRSLFELEVPELIDGAIEIKVIAREPGHRTKIAVVSNDPNVDPVGACVGARGSRQRVAWREGRHRRMA